jgi:hypothetical protein
MSETSLKDGDKRTAPENWLVTGRPRKEATERNNRGLTAGP